MKRITTTLSTFSQTALSLFFLCSMLLSTVAFSLDDYPHSFHIKTNSNNHSDYFQLTTQNKAMGTMLLAPHKHSTYEYFDENNQRQLIVKFTKNYKHSEIWFDVFDNNHLLIAKLYQDINLDSEKPMNITLLTPDKKTILAKGSSNGIGTKLIFYDKLSWHVLAELSRPFFTWSRDADVKVIDNLGFWSLSDLNPYLIPAALALNCLTNPNALVIDPDKPVPAQLLLELTTKLNAITQELNCSDTKAKLSPAQLKTAADTLSQQYQLTYDDTYLSEDEKIQQFIHFGCDMIQSHTYSSEQELAMLQFLKERLAHPGA